MTNIALRDNNSYAVLWNYGIPKYARTRNLQKATISDTTTEVSTEPATLFYY
jgi:hypothetical protein